MDTWSASTVALNMGDFLPKQRFISHSSMWNFYGTLAACGYAWMLAQDWFPLTTIVTEIAMPKLLCTRNKVTTIKPCFLILTANKLGHCIKRSVHTYRQITSSQEKLFIFFRQITSFQEKLFIFFRQITTLCNMTRFATTHHTIWREFSCSMKEIVEFFPGKQRILRQTITSSCNLTGFFLLYKRNHWIFSGKIKEFYVKPYHHHAIWQDFSCSTKKCV